MKSPFLFLNLTNRELTTSDGKLTRYLSEATAVHPDRVMEHLKGAKVDRQFPLVLICEDGAASRKASAALERAGYAHVYMVENGLKGLLSEAQAKPI